MEEIGQVWKYGNGKELQLRGCEVAGLGCLSAAA